MVRTMISAALAATLLSAPVQAQDVGEIVGGIARQYLEQEQDRAAFSQAQQTNTLSAYQSYLRQFPKGAYAEQARERVRRLGGTVSTPNAQAGAASLTADQRVAVQRRLNALGYSTNGLDGNFGPGTRRAGHPRHARLAQWLKRGGNGGRVVPQGHPSPSPEGLGPATGP